MFRSKIKTAAIAGAAVAGLFAMAAPASAAPVSATAAYNGACGSGYTVIDSYKFTTVYGTVYLTYNGSTGYNCVVTVHDYGSAAYTGAYLTRQSDGAGNSDVGEYTRYAGPVYLSAPGTCIKWGGNLGHDEYYTSPWEHCG